MSSEHVSDQQFARDIPGALAKSVRLVMAGKEPLRGVLGEWTSGPGSLQWRETWHYVRNRPDLGRLVGWAVRDPRRMVIRGSETGDAGKAAADAAARDLYWLEGGPFRVD